MLLAHNRLMLGLDSKRKLVNRMMKKKMIWKMSSKKMTMNMKGTSIMMEEMKTLRMEVGWAVVAMTMIIMLLARTIKLTRKEKVVQLCLCALEDQVDKLNNNNNSSALICK
jgi:hypothetical protein